MATKVKLIADNVITTDQIDLTSIDTDNLSEGSTNLYFTNARVDSHLSGGTGVTYSSGEIAIGQAVATDSNVTFADLTVTGDLNITGDINSYNVTDLDVTDKTITLGAGQIEANSDGSGIVVDGSLASILWDETNDWWDYNKGIRLDGEGLKLSFRTSSGAADAEIYTGDTFGSNRLIISGDNGIHNVIDENANGTGDWSVYNDNTSTHLLYVTGSNGNVGIGTNSPAAPLDVDGNFIFKSPTNTLYGNFDTTTAGYGAFRLQNQGSNYGFIGQTSSLLLSGGSNTALGLRSENEFVIATGGSTERMRIDTSGNVGIGTNNPSYPLHISGSGSQRIRVQKTDAGGDADIQFYSPSDSTAWVLFGNSTTGNNSGVIKYVHSTNKMHFRTNGTDNRLVIDNSGNVGIGAEPTNFSNYNNFDVRSKNTSGGAVIGIHDTDGVRVGCISHSESNPAFDIEAFNNNVMRFFTNTSERVRIDSDGHVIVGSHNSTTEAGKLSVYTDATNDAALYGYRSTSYFSIVPFLSNGAFSTLSNVNDSGIFFSDNFVIAKHSSGYYGMIVAGNGNVHIGTESEATGSTGGASFSADNNNRRNLILATTGTTSLELVEFRNPNGTVGTIKTNGTSTSYNTSSDYRLKENVTYEFNALDRVTQLKPARFNFITDADTVLDGFLAHEVSSIVPEAVSGEKDATKEEEYEITPAQYEDDGETLISEAVMGTRTVPVHQGIDQSKLVPLLTKAIQELKIELDAAKARITELEG